jgi:hypothetical protein
VNAWLLLALVAAAAAAYQLGLVYLGSPGRHRRVTAAQAARRRAAARVRVRVHQVIPPRLLADDDAVIEAAAQPARRDAAALYAGLAQIGHTAR